MALLTDSTGAALGYISLDLVSGETTAPMLVFAVASDGAVLKSGESDAFTLQARRTSSGDPYEPLDTGIDLSGDPDGPVSFDLTATGEAVSGLERSAVSIGVTSSSAAGWDD